MKNSNFNHGISPEKLTKMILEDKYIQSLFVEKNNIYTFSTPKIVKNEDGIKYIYPPEILKRVFQIDGFIKQREEQIRKSNGACEN